MSSRILHSQSRSEKSEIFLGEGGGGQGVFVYSQDYLKIFIGGSLNFMGEGRFHTFLITFSIFPFGNSTCFRKSLRAAKFGHGQECKPTLFSSLWECMPRICVFCITSTTSVRFILEFLVKDIRMEAYDLCQTREQKHAFP